MLYRLVRRRLLVCVCGLLLVRGQTTIRPAYERLLVRMRDEYLYEGNRLFLLCPPLHRSSKVEEQAPRGGALFPLIPSKIPVGAVEERNRRAESFSHV